MKTAGIILILFSGTGLGLCKSMELTARLKILEKLAQLLLLLKGEIRCTGATLEDAFLDAFRLILPRLSIENATTFVFAEIVGTVIV